MRNAVSLPIVLIISLFLCAGGWAQEGKTSKDSKPKGTLTLLGTIKGEIDKVSDGGRKLEVKYKEMVTTTTRSNSSTTKGSTSGKYRPPVPKEFTQKEKNQEIEVRLLDSAVIRILETSEAPPPPKGTDKKKKSEKATDKNEEKKDEEKKDTDDEMEKTKEKSPTKPTRKSSEPPLPGKAGDLGSLLKGQYIIITVYREDLPGFSRLVASTVYILGEK